MKKTLRPFQISGANFLASNPHALLADEPGAGKTIQVLAAAETLGFNQNLVICPASVRTNWAQEITECLGAAALKNWEIVSYNYVANGGLIRGAWDLLVLDEAHFLKTVDSQRTQAVFGNENGVARRANYKWCLTGTPILNRPREMYPILKTLAASKIAPYTTFPSFAQRFCGAYFDGRGINTKGASHLDDLSNRLKGFMLRRTLAEVAPELPPRIIHRIPLDVWPEDMKIIREEEDKIQNREALLSPAAEEYSQLGDMARLLRAVGLAKVRATIQFLVDVLETESKVVVFTRHRDVLSRLSEALGDRGIANVTYQGGMDDERKKASVEEFVRNENCRAFIGNITAAGTGINGLQERCASVVFAEIDWVPGVMEQAIRRLQRIGQRASTVNVYVLHVPGSLESAVLNVSDGKSLVIERLLGDTVLAGLI